MTTRSTQRIILACAAVALLCAAVAPAFAFPTQASPCDTCHPKSPLVSVKATQVGGGAIQSWRINVTGPLGASLGWAVNPASASWSPTWQFLSGSSDTTMVYIWSNSSVTAWGVADNKLSGGTFSGSAVTTFTAPGGTVVTTTTTTTTTVTVTTTTTSTTHPVTVPLLPHTYFKSNLGTTAASWRAVCNRCHSKKHKKDCITCHGPGGRKNVHLVRAHTRSSAMCFICHNVPSAWQTLACLTCHKF